MDKIYCNQSKPKGIRISFQPYLEKNTNYISYIPQEKSMYSNYVAEIYQVDQFDKRKNIALPDITADIMLFYTQDNCYSYVMGSSNYIQDMTRLPFFLDINSIFGVRLKTGCPGKLFRYAVQDVGNSQIKLEDALYDGEKITEELTLARSFHDRWEIISQYIRSRIADCSDNDAIADYAIHEILKSHGNITVRELENKTGYSGRYLRSLVGGVVGISIKQFCELARFQWMCNYYQNNIKSTTLPDLAIEAGYYDQSHMNLSCRNLTGKLPREILNLYSAHACKALDEKDKYMHGKCDM